MDGINHLTKRICPVWTERFDVLLIDQINDGDDVYGKYFVNVL
jgi:hypothetical protein